MVRSVEDASILMGAISDVDLHGCDVDIINCLDDHVKYFDQLKNVESLKSRLFSEF